MNRDFVIGFAVCAGMFCLMAFSPQYGIRESERDQSEIYKRLENLSFDVRTSTPDLSNLGEGQMILVNSNGAISEFTRVSNTLQYRTFTRWN